MKFFNKYLFLAFVACSGLAACDDDDDDFAPGRPAAGGVEVSFDHNNASKAALGVDDYEISLLLNRSDSKGDLSVPLKFSCASNIIDAPSSVDFKDGESSTVLTFKVNENMKMFQNYLVSVSVDEAFTNPYKPVSVIDEESGESVAEYPLMNLRLVKEDYVDVYSGTYISEFWEEQWDATIQYSEIQGLYRLSDWIIPDYTFYFTMEDNKVIVSQELTYIGWDYDDDGVAYSVSAAYNEDAVDGFFFDPETNSFHFNFEFVLPDYPGGGASFDYADEVFQVVE